MKIFVTKLQILESEVYSAVICESRRLYFFYFDVISMYNFRYKKNTLWDTEILELTKTSSALW